MKTTILKSVLAYHPTRAFLIGHAWHLWHSALTRKSLDPGEFAFWDKFDRDFQGNKMMGRLLGPIKIERRAIKSRKPSSWTRQA